MSYYVNTSYLLGGATMKVITDIDIANAEKILKDMRIRKRKQEQKQQLQKLHERGLLFVELEAVVEKIIGRELNKTDLNNFCKFIELQEQSVQLVSKFIMGG
jgi:hypothetical protein